MSSPRVYNYSLALFLFLYSFFCDIATSNYCFSVYCRVGESCVSIDRIIDDRTRVYDFSVRTRMWKYAEDTPGFFPWDSLRIIDGHGASWFEHPLPPHECVLVEHEDEAEAEAEAVAAAMAGAAAESRGRRVARSVLRRLVLWSMPSPRHPLTRRLLRSTASVNAERRRQARARRFAIHPFSPLSFYWDLAMGATVLLALIVLPWKAMVLFGHRYGVIKESPIVLATNLACLFITCFIDLMYVLDLVMAFVRGVEDYSNHVVHLDRRTIVRNYWRKRLLLDILSVFPWTLAIFMGYPVHEACFNLLKVVRIPCVCRALHLLLISKVRLWYVAMKKACIVLVPILTIHWLACLSLVFSTGWQGVDRTLWSPTSWLHKLCLSSETTSDVYWRSSFRVMSTLMFVKVHNLLTPEDIVVEILSAVVGAVLFIFLTLQGFILLRMYRGASLQVEGKVAQLEEFMKYTDLPDQQRDRLSEYFKYCFRKFYFREYQILAFISEHLREDIMMYSCHSAVSSVPFFSDLPLDVMVRIVLCLRNEIFMENEVVVQAGTTGNSMYFIASGTVVVFSASGNEICHLQDGAFFGEIAMLSGDETRIASVVAVETCELYCLEREDFLSTVAAHPDLLKRMEETALYRLDQTVALDEKSRRFTTRSTQQRVEARRASASAAGQSEPEASGRD